MRKIRQSAASRDSVVEELNRLREENRRLREELEVDDLTGLYNSRSLRARLESTLAQRFAKDQRPALLFLDVDHFKRINEKHGHRAAGHLLRQIGRLLVQNIREGDVAFRYGGDEFVVLVSGGREGALRAGERIRRAVEKHPFRVNGLRGLGRVQLTVSIGTHVMGVGDTAAKILDRADQAMYEAKKQSRNKVISSAA